MRINTSHSHHSVEITDINWKSIYHIFNECPKVHKPNHIWSLNPNSSWNHQACHHLLYKNYHTILMPFNIKTHNSTHSLTYTPLSFIVYGSIWDKGSLKAQLVWNMLCSQGWAWCQRSACLCLLTAETKGMHHLNQPKPHIISI